jgi:hypothetical protein
MYSYLNKPGQDDKKKLGMVLTEITPLKMCSEDIVAQC